MKVWLRLHLGGQIWRVVIVPPKSRLLIDHKDERVCGRTWTDKCTIALSRDLSPEAREDTLLHELLHALFYVCGGFNVIEKLTPVGVEPQDNEDAIVHPLVPLLHRVLKDLGFHFPKGP